MRLRRLGPTRISGLGFLHTALSDSRPPFTRRVTYSVAEFLCVRAPLQCGFDRDGVNAGTEEAALIILRRGSSLILLNLALTPTHYAHPSITAEIKQRVSRVPMKARSKYTPAAPPKVSSERREILPITNPRDAPAFVYRNAALPELPTPQRKGILEEWFTLSTHILQAAFPRSGPDVPYPEGSDADGLVVPRAEGGPARAETGIKVRKALCEINKKHWLGELRGNSERPLWLCVNRFVRKTSSVGDQERGRKRVTLLLAHANGFGKEVRPFFQLSLMHPIAKCLEAVLGTCPHARSIE